MQQELWRGDVFVAKPDNSVHAQRRIYVVDDVNPSAVVFKVYDHTGTVLQDPVGRFSKTFKRIAIAKDMLEPKYAAVRTRDKGLHADSPLVTKSLRQALASIPLWDQ